MTGHIIKLGSGHVTVNGKVITMVQPSRWIPIKLVMTCILGLLVTGPATHGGDWLSDVRLTNTLGAGNDPAGRGNLQVDSEGNVFIAWQLIRVDRKLDDIGLIRWLRRTNLWDPPIGSPPYIAPFCYGIESNHFSLDPSICISSDGIINFVGLDLRDTTPTVPFDTSRLVNTPSYRSFNPKDSSWSMCEFITMSEGNGNLPMVVGDFMDNLYVTWFDDRSGHWEVYFQERDAITGLWAPSDSIISAYDNYDSRDPFQIVDDGGNLHVVWNTKYDGSSVIVYRSRDFTTGEWLPIEEVTDDATIKNAEKALIAADATGRLHVVWLDNKDGNKDIYHRIKEGPTWLPSERLTNNYLKNLAPYMVADGAGDIHLIYLEGATIDSMELIYRKWSQVTRAWSENQTLVSKTVEKTVFGPKIMVDKYGYIHVDWLDNRHEDSWELYYKKYSPYVVSPLVAFDKSVYVGVADKAVITVQDASMNNNLLIRDELTVRVVSDTDTTGIDITLKETGINTAIFSSTVLGNNVRFSLMSSNPSIPRLQVYDGDKVMVKYQDDSPIKERVAEARWYKTSAPTPTPSGSPVPVTRHKAFLLLAMFVVIVIVLNGKLKNTV